MVLLITAIYLILMGVILNTENMISLALFKLIPITLGILLIVQNYETILKVIQ